MSNEANQEMMDLKYKQEKMERILKTKNVEDYEGGDGEQVDIRKSSEKKDVRDFLNSDINKVENGLNTNRSDVFNQVTDRPLKASNKSIIQKSN